METTTMKELNLNELEMVNGGKSKVIGMPTIRPDNGYIISQQLIMPGDIVTGPPDIATGLLEAIKLYKYYYGKN